MIFRFRRKHVWLEEITVYVTTLLITLQNVFANNNRRCGYIDFGFDEHETNGRVNVYEGQRISDTIKFKDIYNKFTNTSTVIRVEDSNCFIEICGHPTILGQRKRVIIPSCTRFWDVNSSLPLPRDLSKRKFEGTSILCGCKKNYRPNCASEDCDNRSFNGTGICSVLYQEDKCKDCTFDGITLLHNDTFNSKNDAVVRSVYIQPGCLLEETAYGYSYYSPVDYPVQDFIPYTVVHNESTAIVPSHTLLGVEFFCTCPNLNVVESKSTEIIKLQIEPESFPVHFAWGAGVLGILAILVTAFLILMRYWIMNKPQPVIPKSEITQFWEGVTNSVYFAKGDEDAAPGVLQACFAPYNSDLEISREELEFNPSNGKSVLGNGMFGIVFKGKYRKRIPNSGKVSQDVAIKTVKPFSESGYIKSILNEVKVLAFIGDHPNIVRLIGACTNNLAMGEVYIVLELCSNGCLKNYLISIKDTLPTQNKQFKPNACHPDYLEFSEEIQEEIKPPELSQSWLLQLFKWSKEIATGMEFLADKHVLHIDLAARNVLLTEELVVKIGDFGLSRKLYARQDYTKYSREPVPTKGNALECLTKKKYSVKSDVWSYGVTLWEIFSLGDDPYRGLDYQEIVDFLNAGNRLARPTYANMEIYEKTMLSCWDEEIEKRPSFSEMRKYFEKILLNYESEVLDS